MQVPSLTTSYTKWFQTRSHLARCNTVLATLKPLHLYEHPAALTSESDLSRLQDKLIELATTNGADLSLPPRPGELPPTRGVHGGLPPAAPPSPMMLTSGATSPRPSPPSPYPSLLGGTRAALATSRMTEPDATTQSHRASLEALRGLLRIALVKGTLPDHLKALRALLAASGWGERSALPKAGRRRSASELPPVIEAVAGLRELQAACASVLTQRGLVFCSSASLGNVPTHATLGIHPRADFSSRGALLASGCLEPCAASAVLSSLLAQCAASTVWGVGPWEHDYSSLSHEPPPDEIASAVALAAAEQLDSSPDADSPPDLQISVPLCVDVSPQTVHLLLHALVDTLEEVGSIDALQSTADCAIAYTCLSLMRLLKVHLHYICTTRIALADLGLDIDAPLPKEAADARAQAEGPGSRGPRGESGGSESANGSAAGVGVPPSAASAQAAALRPSSATGDADGGADGSDADGSAESDGTESVADGGAEGRVDLAGATPATLGGHAAAGGGQRGSVAQVPPVPSAAEGSAAAATASATAAAMAAAAAAGTGEAASASAVLSAGGSPPPGLGFGLWFWVGLG